MTFVPDFVFVAHELEGWAIDVVRGTARATPGVYLLEISVFTGEEARPTEGVVQLPLPKNPEDHVGGWEWTTT